MSDILSYLDRTLPAVATGSMLYFLSRPWRMWRLRTREEGAGPVHECLFFVFFVLMAGILWLTVLPKLLWINGHIVFREEGIGEINLKPFTIFWQSKILANQGHDHYFLINFWGNIAMFLPVGLFPGLLWKNVRWWQVTVAGIGLSLMIELLQIPIHRGADVDDLWLNTLGVLLGWVAARCLSRICPKFSEKCKIRRFSYGRL